MPKMALFDCAINEKCCSVDGGRGICPLFSSPPSPPPPTTGIWQLKSPHPREFAIQGKKMLMPGDQPGEGGWGWAQVELTDALVRLELRKASESIQSVLIQIRFFLMKTSSGVWPGSKFNFNSNFLNLLYTEK